jgi:hypothetical protein
MPHKARRTAGKGIAAPKAEKAPVAHARSPREAAASQRETALLVQVELLRAEVSTLKSYLADRTEELRRYEAADAWRKSRGVEEKLDTE